ncbi:hypothetical protein BpHYR1_042308 [Brachionus plicatilis]|uniref:Uncharacterized protein n=1 Tax=Brachionus plicatilis TaxID=10195 RepID=A0A3M7TA83_BRAPC|nr:hypothetical protein BpHYR1_042308 [Brachionus plicatilis]
MSQNHKIWTRVKSSLITFIYYTRLQQIIKIKNSLTEPDILRCLAIAVYSRKNVVSVYYLTYLGAHFFFNIQYSKLYITKRAKEHCII